MLVCPACHAPLTWQIEERRGNRIETGAATCEQCETTYLILEGIAHFLTPEHLQTNVESQDSAWGQPERRTDGLYALYQYLRDHPDVKRQLMFAPLQALSPVDQFFRAALLEGRGEYVRARTTENVARMGLYTPAYLDAWNSQYEYIIDHLLGRVPSLVEGPLVNVACGRGRLLNRLVQKFNYPIIASDLSPFVLRRNRRWLEFFGLYDKVNLLAFDIRYQPFKTGAIDAMVTDLEFSNIGELSAPLQELRRVLHTNRGSNEDKHAAEFLAISHFYTEDDATNGAMIQELALTSFLYKQAMIEGFKDAGFRVSIENTQESMAKPMPSSDLVPDAKMDTLPVVETVLEWGVVVARSCAHDCA
jgi:uncharacterized protein YbaR (Trm112 family)